MKRKSKGKGRRRSTHLPVRGNDADNPILVKQFQICALMKVAIVQDHTSQATPLFFTADDEVLIEPQSDLRLSRQETLHLDTAVQV